MISALPYNFLGLNSLTEDPGRERGIGAGTGFPSGERTSIVRGWVTGRVALRTETGESVMRVRRMEVLGCREGLLVF